MKKFLLLFVLVSCCISCYSQDEQRLKKYFEEQASLLDPIEGIYEVEFSGDYVTPFGHWKYPKSSKTAYIIKADYKYCVFVNHKGNIEESNMEIVPIADNAYRFYVNKSCSRIYLQNRNHFVATVELDNESAKKYTGNPNLASSVRITLRYDFIKTCPNG